LGRGTPRTAPGPGEVRVEHPGELLLAHPHEQRVVGDAGVRDEDLNRTQLVLHRGEGGVNRSLVGDVTADRERAGGSAGATMGHRDSVTLLDERLRDREPDPPVTPSDHHGACQGSSSFERHSNVSLWATGWYLAIG